MASRAIAGCESDPSTEGTNVMNFYDSWSIDAMVQERRQRLHAEAEAYRLRREILGEQPAARRLRLAIGLQIVHLGQRISGLSARELTFTQTGPSLT
jgi:hypothetical protein